MTDSPQRKRTRSRRPFVIADAASAQPIARDGSLLGVVLVTGRTTAKGDRSGMPVKTPRDAHVGRYFDGSVNTVEPHTERDPETGRLLGVKIAPCSACGHVRRIQTVTALCGVSSCVRQRHRRYLKRLERRRAADYLAGLTRATPTP